MKLLILHNKYIVSGGEDVSSQAEVNLLRHAGHHVDYISVDNTNINRKNFFSLALNTFWSSSYYKKVEDLIKRNKYDLIHVQNFFPQISPSVFYAAKRNGTKIIMSVRNYRLICPNALMYVNGNICNKCVGLSFPYPAIKNKCYKNDVAATCVATGMMTMHNIMDTWNLKIDGFIAISEFVKNQLINGGISANKIHVKYNFVATPLISHSIETYDRYLYVGRLSTEKGIRNMLDAFNHPRLRNHKLTIIGEGPYVNLVENAIVNNSNIEYLGKLSLADTYSLMSKSRALVFPSTWHEPFGRTVVESFAVGTPVVGSKLGGVTELIQDGYNGYLFNPYNIESMIDSICKIDSFSDYDILRYNAKKTYEEQFTAEKNYQQVIRIYSEILGKTIE